MATRKRAWTVVLQRSATLCEWLDDAEFYVAMGVKAFNECEAVTAAKEEAKAADIPDVLSNAGGRLTKDFVTVDDYDHVVVFEGSHEPKLYHFQRS